MADWLQQFFEEKNLSSNIFKVEYKGITHMVESEFVIDLIKSSSFFREGKNQRHLSPDRF